jgi:hypothetical protein
MKRSLRSTMGRRHFRPRRLPIRRTPNRWHLPPCHCSRIQILFRIRHEPFAYGIQPNVPSYGLQGFCALQNVFVEISLPQDATEFRGKPPGAFDLEALHKMQEITGWRQTLSEEMKVVRHQTICVHAEGMGNRFRAQQFQQPIGESLIQKHRLTAETTNRHEVIILAEVIEVRETGGFADG